jgi:hypothetical protein
MSNAPDAADDLLDEFGHAWDLHWITDKFVYVYSHCNPPFSAQLRVRIVGDLINKLPDYGIKQYFDGQKHIFDLSDHIALGVDRATREFISINAARWYPFRNSHFLYHWTMMIGNEYRGTSLASQTRAMCYRGLLSRRRFPHIIAGKTYNPKVYEYMRSAFCRTPGIRMYPDIANIARSDEEMQLLAKDIAGIVAPNHTYIADKSILIGTQAAAGPDYFPYMQKTNDKIVWDFFSENVTRADQVLYVIDIPESATAALTDRNHWAIPGGSR